MNNLLTAFVLFSAIVFVACGEKSDSKQDIEGYKASEIIKNTATAKDDDAATNTDATEEDEIVAAEKSNTPSEMPAFDFPEMEYQFGKVFEGEKVTKTFTFTNSGKAPLLIQNAKASCGCTVPSWPKQAIAPGEEGKIDVVFNTKGKMGNQRKTITITANTEPNITTLVITGDVVKGVSEEGPVNE